MSDVVKLFKSDEDSYRSSIEQFLKNITEAIQNNKISSLMCIAYMTEEEAETSGDESVIYMAGDYKSDREVLGDLRLLEQAVIDGEL